MERVMIIYNCRKLGLKNYLGKSESYIEKVIYIVELMDKWQKSGTFTKYEKAEALLGSFEDLLHCKVEENILDTFMKNTDTSIEPKDVKPLQVKDKKNQVQLLFSEGKSKKEISVLLGLSNTYINKILKNES